MSYKITALKKLAVQPNTHAHSIIDYRGWKGSLGVIQSGGFPVLSQSFQNSTERFQTNIKKSSRVVQLHVFFFFCWWWEVHPEGSRSKALFFKRNPIFCLYCINWSSTDFVSRTGSMIKQRLKSTDLIQILHFKDEEMEIQKAPSISPRFCKYLAKPCSVEERRIALCYLCYCQVPNKCWRQIIWVGTITGKHWWTGSASQRRLDLNSAMAWGAGFKERGAQHRYNLSRSAGVLMHLECSSSHSLWKWCQLPMSPAHKTF